MSSGGKNQTSTKSTTTAPPAYLQNAYSNIVGAGTQLAQQPLQQYTGPLVAGFAPQQEQAFQTVENAQGMAQPYYNAATDLTAIGSGPVSAPGVLTGEQAQGVLANGLGLSQRAANTNIAGAGGAGSSVAENAANKAWNVLDPNLVNAGLGASQNAVTAAQGAYGALNPALVGAGLGYTQGAVDSANTDVYGQLPQFNSSNLDQFLNPYTNDVVKATQAQFANQNAQEHQATAGNAIKAGAWGTDRSGIAQAELSNQEQLAQAPVIAGLISQGYDKATAALLAQQQLKAQTLGQTAQLGATTGLGAAGSTLQAAGLGANTGLSAAQLNAQTGLSLGNQYETAAQLGATTGLGAAGLGVQAGLGAGNIAASSAANQAQAQQAAANSQMAAALAQQQLALQGQTTSANLAQQGGAQIAGIGTQAQQSALQGASANLQSGALQQQLAQEQLNIPYEQFLQQQAYPYQQLQFLSGLTTGIGAQAGGTQSTTATQPGPSLVSQLVGLGTAGYGMFGGASDPTAGASPAAVSPDSLGLRSGGRARRADGGIADASTPINFGDPVGSPVGLGALQGGPKPNSAADFTSYKTGPYGVPLPHVSSNLFSQPGGGGMGVPSLAQEQSTSAPSTAPQNPALSGLGNTMSVPKPSTSDGSASDGKGFDWVGAALTAAKIAAMFLKDGGRVHLADGGWGAGTEDDPVDPVAWLTHQFTQPSPPIYGRSARRAAPPASQYGGAGQLPYMSPLGPLGAANTPWPAQDAPVSVPPAMSADRMPTGNSGLGAEPVTAPLLPNSPLASNRKPSTYPNSPMRLAGMPNATFPSRAAPPPKQGGGLGARPPAHPAVPTMRPDQIDTGDDDTSVNLLDDARDQTAQSLGATVLPKDQTPDSWQQKAAGTGFDYRPSKPDPKQALITAGLAMAAGESPFALTNIAKGALAGEEEYARESDMDKNPVINDAGETIRIYYPSEKKWIDTGVPTEASLRTKEDIAYRNSQEAATAVREKADAARQATTDAKEAAYEAYLERTGAHQNATEDLALHGYKPYGAPDADGNLIMTNEAGDIKVSNVKVGAKPGAAGAGGGVSKWKYDAWLAVHPNDTQGALDFVAGHKQIAPADAFKFGYAQASKEAAQGLLDDTSKAGIDARAKELSSTITSAGAAPAAHPVLAAPPPMAQRTPGMVVQSPKGPVKWTGTAWVPNGP